ncbi:LPS export ABC transporter periplasmic protein LptC [Coxiella endosymbiont of Amblyomma americanum]|uniref:LPS export ABC transporter periplasmic protein LptC n=2 Tax=Coxiellaceae TaxID=118968 RepID=UPI00057CDBC8|nr:LPS export ABC transporter periplasmic protein LptC [Coxiella endosymbiont of Amblyomma americanum]AJC50351.1 hypothetical protein Z664_01180 [Coxiella endosymbiont of Amblyomma americanum]
MNKYIMLIILIILVFFTTTLTLYNFSFHKKKPSVKQLNYQPDVFMRKINYCQYDDFGRLRSHLISFFILHFPHKNSSFFIAPHYLFYTNKHIWVINAIYGKSQNETSGVYLWKHVKIYELSQTTKTKTTHSNSQNTTITTQNIMIFPSCLFARTDQLVTIVRPNLIIKATGMIINLKNGVINLLSNTCGIWNF